NGIDGPSAKLVGTTDGQGRVDPSLDFDPQGPAGPAGASVGVADAGYGGRHVFGSGDQAGVDAVEQPAADIGGDFPAHATDEQGPRYPGYRVSPALAGGYRDQPGQGASGGQRVEPGVFGVADQGGRLDASAHP